MLRNIVVSLAIWTVLVLAAQAAEARRVALVIGIDSYGAVPKLDKAVGDARAMAATLSELGFAVTQVLNADRRTLNIAISQFTSALTPDDVAFVHFSGHGVEIDGENFLLPADIPKPASGHKDAVRYEAVALQRLIAQVARSGARTRLFVIDACRNNPFQQAGTRGIGGARGLAYAAAPAGTFVMYSAGYGQLALDKLGAEDAEPTSVYTRVLTEKLRQPGRSVAQIAQDVRGEVQRLAKSIGHDQRPAYYDELSAPLVLREAQQATVAAVEPAAPAATGSQIELAFWNSVKDSERPELFELYLKRYPQGSFAPLARLQLEALKPSAPAPAPAGPAAQDAEKSPERQIVVEPRDAPDAGTVRAVQSELNRLGCSAGTADGLWGRNSAAALGRFARYGKTRLPDKQPTQRILDMLKARTGRVCPCPAGTRETNGRCTAVVRKTQPAAPAKQPKAAKRQPVVKKAARPAQKTYRNPRIGGVPVDICVGPFKSCKGAAARQWCRSKGYGTALSWSHAIYPKTRHISGGYCVPSGLVVCGGYNRIVCAS